MEYQFTIFYYDGKTYIGRIVTNLNGKKVTFPGGVTVDSVGADAVKNDWIVCAPCEVSFNLENKENTGAKLTFKNLMPLVPNKIVTDSDTSNVYFRFHKDKTVLSSVIGTDKFSSDLINAYKIMTGIENL